MSVAAAERYVSCDARRLYRDGGFYDEPSLGESLAGEQASGVRILTEAYPAFAYKRALPECIEAPEHFRRELLGLYDGINRGNRTGASCLMVELSDVVLAHNVLYVAREGRRRIVYETHRPPDRPCSPLIGSDAAVTPFPAARNALYFFLGSVGSFNYGHWLLDDLPRLRALEALRAAHPRREIVVVLPQYGGGAEPTLSHWDESRAAVIMRLLRGMGGCSVSFVDVAHARSFERLCYATPMSFHPVLKSPEAMAWLARRLGRQQWLRRLWRRPTRLLVMRRAARGRTLENIEAVHTLLEQRGFSSIEPEDLSIAQQARAFAQADVVVGVMGASMSSTVFCRPGTRVIHLVPEGWKEPFYWDLAAVRRHRYAACYGPALDEGPAHLSSFHMPEPSLVRVLHALNC
jgi:hypothetical protein